MVKIASKLAARKLGFRNLLDIIPLDASLVKGSHGRIDNPDSRVSGIHWEWEQRRNCRYRNFERDSFQPGN